jgi:hypothetical protein
VRNIFARNKQIIESTKREILAGVRIKPRERFGVRSESRILWTKEVLRIFGLEGTRPFLGSCTDKAPNREYRVWFVWNFQSWIERESVWVWVSVGLHMKPNNFRSTSVCCILSYWMCCTASSFYFTISSLPSNLPLSARNIQVNSILAHELIHTLQ